MSITGFRLGLCVAVLAALALVAAPWQELRADVAPTKPRLISEMPALKPGDKVKVVRAEIKTLTTDEGLQDVTEIVEPAGAGDEVALPTTHWQLDVDGWFDEEGLNLTAIYPRSGLWSWRRMSVRLEKPPEKKEAKKADALDPLQFPVRPLPVFPELGDMISHVDGVAVTSYPALVYAVNAAKNKRDVPVVHVNGRTGRKRLMYVTLHKDPLP